MLVALFRTPRKPWNPRGKETISLNSDCARFLRENHQLAANDFHSGSFFCGAELPVPVSSS